MIKKLLLLTGLTISTSLWASPMDDICSVNTIDSSYTLVAETISKCERNNILYMYSNGKENFDSEFTFSDGSKLIDVAPLSELIKLYCRYDRNVNNMIEDDFPKFDCVLYDNKPREYIDLRK